jgi:FkbM family methyltransferase
MENRSLFSDLKYYFDSGNISREEYWKGLNSFLSEMLFFAQIQREYSTDIAINNGEIFLKIRTSKTSEGKITMVYKPNDIRSVPFTVLAHGFYEPFQADILVELANRSKTFADIGANMGFYSLALCKENLNLHTYAFEPNLNVYNTLNFNSKLNKLTSRITTYNFGLSNTNDEVLMYEPQFSGTAAASLRKLNSEEGPYLEFKVKIKKLDELKLPKLDLIKIDVEGSEYNVLLGANETIFSDRPTICAELLRKWMKPFGHKPQDVVDRLLSLNYNCFAISKKSLSNITEINDNSLETNFIFCHESKAAHINYLRGLVA